MQPSLMPTHREALSSTLTASLDRPAHDNLTKRRILRDIPPAVSRVGAGAWTVTRGQHGDYACSLDSWERYGIEARGCGALLGPSSSAPIVAHQHDASSVPGHQHHRPEPESAPEGHLIAPLPIQSLLQFPGSKLV